MFTYIVGDHARTSILVIERADDCDKPLAVRALCGSSSHTFIESVSFIPVLVRDLRPMTRV